MSSLRHKAVLFDLDGTLLDTLDDLADSMNAVLAAAGFPIHAVHKYKYFVGDGVETLVRRVLPSDSNANEPLVDQLGAAMRTEYAKHWRDKTKPYQGVPELLDALVARNLTLAVLSN